MTVVANGYRIRVQRLLRGDYQRDDLAQLFLFVRDKCGNRASVTEIGDFVAHQKERTKKTILTSAVRDFFTVTKFKISNMNKLVQAADHLPSGTIEVLDATWRMLEDKFIKQKTGYT